MEEFLSRNRIPYDTRDVDRYPLTPQELWELFNRKANRLRAPFTALNDGEDVVLGYDPQRLEAVFVRGHLGAAERGTAVRGSETYDALTAAVLRSDRWTIAQMRDEHGVTHPYADPNAQVQTGDGWFEVTIDPFTRFHDTVQVLNNPKQLYMSTQRIATPPGTEVCFETDMAVETFRQTPYDLRDSFGTINLLDFTTGMVLDFAATNDTVFVVYERLLIPGVTTEEEYFAHRVVLEVEAGPGLKHHYGIVYRRDISQAEWYVDGKRVYWATTPVPVEGFNLGMGLFSSRAIDRYRREEREHGQGARGRWAPWRITTVEVDR